MFFERNPDFLKLYSIDMLKGVCMKKSLPLGITGILFSLAPVFSEKIAVEISTDQPSAITTLNGEEKRIRLPAILFLEKNREYQFGIKGEKGFTFDSEGLTFLRPEKLRIKLSYEPYVIGKEYCYGALLLPGICGVTTGEHVLGGSLILSSVAGLYITAFYLRSLAAAAKADYNALPAGTRQGDFDSQIKKAHDQNTNFGVTLGVALLWHFIASMIDGGLWGVPIYAQDPRLPNAVRVPESISFKTRTTQYPGEAINYAYTTKEF
ncbi:MAG: hypothetical protein J0L53_01725 [Spirochaetes bacterium]|nr:hypothetical protein [Spirochaetota bacterium]